MPRGTSAPKRRIVARRTRRTNVRHARRSTNIPAPLRSSVRFRRTASVTTNALRRFMLAPARVKSDGTAVDKWWFEGLKTFGIIIMRIIAYALSADGLRRHLMRHPLSEPLDSLAKAAIPCASVLKVGFGPEDLLTETSFVTVDSAGTGTGHFRQARVKWVNFIINPPTTLGNRGGMLAAALLPVTREQYEDDLSAISTEHFTMRELMSIPGAICKSASSPTTLRYSPRPTDFASSWMQFGKQKQSSREGGDICVYLCVCYHNMAADTSDTAPQFSPSHALLDLTIESKVQLREYDEEVMVRSQPPVLTPASVIGVTAFKNHQLVDVSSCVNHHGVLLFGDTSYDMLDD